MLKLDQSRRCETAHLVAAVGVRDYGREDVLGLADSSFTLSLPATLLWL